MQPEFIIRGLKGVGEGLAASFISGGLDINYAKKGERELEDVILTTGVVTGICVLAAVCLDTPPLIPVALSVLARVSHETRELFLKFNQRE